MMSMLNRAAATVAAIRMRVDSFMRLKRLPEKYGANGSMFRWVRVCGRAMLGV